MEDLLKGVEFLFWRLVQEIQVVNKLGKSLFDYLLQFIADHLSLFHLLILTLMTILHLLDLVAVAIFNREFPNDKGFEGQSNQYVYMKVNG
jgi:hypothetical protein